MTQTSIHMFIAGLAAAAITGSGNAATFFTEDFSDNSEGPNMALGAGLGAPTTDFNGDFSITSGLNSRIYLGTNDTDYSTIDFIFEAEITITQASDWAIAFFGMGNSDADSLAFGEPVTGPNVFATLWPGQLHGVHFKDNTINSFSSTSVFSANPADMIGTHFMRLTWDSVTGTATFNVDLQNDSIFDSTIVVDGSDNGFNGTNSQLLLGGGNQTSFDNIVVKAVPEPGSLALIGLGGIAMWRRRRSS